MLKHILRTATWRQKALPSSLVLCLLYVSSCCISVSVSLSHARVCLSRHDLASALTSPSLPLSLSLFYCSGSRGDSASAKARWRWSRKACYNERIDLCTLFLGVTKTKTRVEGESERGKGGWVGGALGFFFFAFEGFFFRFVRISLFFFCWEGRDFSLSFFLFFFSGPRPFRP